jgi:L-glyceraldehyde 3-phosphate reductase
MPDPLARETVPNPFGGRNSVLKVAGLPEESPSRRRRYCVMILSLMFEGWRSLLPMSVSAQVLAWVLRHKTVASALIGASRVSQVDDCVSATRNLNFTSEELARIDGVLAD